jgi:queuosine precursor transporter
MRRLTAVSAALAFVATVWFANWLVNHYGPIRVWPTHLLAPAGVYVIGLAFLLRDTIQRLWGVPLALAAIAAGTGLSVLVSPTLAEASALAFLASEATGLLIFRLLRGNTGGPPVLGMAVIASSLAAAAIDSYVFLSIAFHSLAFFQGQFVAKIMVTALALPFVFAARRRYPAQHVTLSPTLEKVS